MSADTTRQQSPITQRDLAHHLQISQQAVSRALRHDPRISADTVARVIAAAEELGYDIAQHQAARRMALIKVGGVVSNHLVCLLAHRSFTEANYFIELFRGIMHGLTAQGYDLITSHTDGAPETLVLPMSVRRGDVDGVISMIRPEATRRFLELARGLPTFGGRPVVSLMWAVPGACSVRVDDEMCGYLAMRHLLQGGHRQVVRLAFINLPGDPEALRFQGMRRALREHGLEPADCLTTLYIGHESWLNSPPFTDELASPAYELRASGGAPVGSLPDYLHRRPEVTALLALNDGSAIRAWYLLERAGIRIPADISLIGFDDTDPMLDAEGRNILTTVRAPLRQIGQEAARLLLQAQAGGEIVEEQVVMPPELIIRQSTR